MNCSEKCTQLNLLISPTSINVLGNDCATCLNSSLLWEKINIW